MSAIVTAERPDTPDAIALITELEVVPEPLYPRESCHGLNVERLIAEAVRFLYSTQAG
jgi:putative acetyltransferase